MQSCHLVLVADRHRLQKVFEAGSPMRCRNIGCQWLQRTCGECSYEAVDWQGFLQTDDLIFAKVSKVRRRWEFGKGDGWYMLDLCNCQELNLTVVKGNRNSRPELLPHSELNIGSIVSGTFRDESASAPLLLILLKVFSEIPLLDKPSLPLSSRSPNDTHE